jgi:3-hydroxyisobutyrate dehydrogenase-like beta-hydroxyacid dehydrogenase
VNEAAMAVAPMAKAPTAPTLRIGWVGLGRIGRPMAERVQAAGWPMRVWARQPAATHALQAAGAQVCPTLEELAHNSDLVFTIVGGPTDVQAVLGTMLPAARPGTLFIDMTTTSALQAAPLRDLATAGQLQLLDAPVTGGVAGAQRGALTSFVGGTIDALDLARPVLKAFSQHIVHAGEWGSGYRMKLLNQTLVAGTLMGLADGARLARALGLAVEAVPAALAQGTASGKLFESYWGRMHSGVGAITFSLGLLRKDLLLVAEEASHLGLALPQVQATLAAVDAACRRHGEQAGVQALAAP